jgi:hypothetical protein
MTRYSRKHLGIWASGHSFRFQLRSQHSIDDSKRIKQGDLRLAILGYRVLNHRCNENLFRILKLLFCKNLKIFVAHLDTCKLLESSNVRLSTRSVTQPFAGFRRRFVQEKKFPFSQPGLSALSVEVCSCRKCGNPQQK